MTSRPSTAGRTELLDETDPHAGDDLEWTDAAPAEPQPLLFWRGLAVGLALSAIGWALLTAVGLTLYALFG